MKKIEETISLSELREVAKNLSEAEIIDNLVVIFSFKKSREQGFRDLASEILDRISQKELLSIYPTLLDMLKSQYHFVRDEAQKLLEKIEAKLLLSKFDELLILRNDQDFTTKRFAQATLLRISQIWSLKDKKLNYGLILEWKKSKDANTVQVANFLELHVMTAWSAKDLEMFLPFLIECTDLDKNSFETSELAAYLALKCLYAANSSVQIEYLGYMASFSDYAQEEMRRNFRHLSLETMKSLDSKSYTKYASFFLRCLEGNNKEDRTNAWKNLLQINPDELPICDLVYAQASGLYRVRKATKKLAKRVGEDVLLANLEDLILMQDSKYCYVKSLSKYLVGKIPTYKLETKKEILERCSKSLYFGAAVLAEDLLELI